MNKHRLGEYTFSVADPAASNGKAVMMPGSHFEWATSCNVSPLLELLEPIEKGESPSYHVYAYVRCDASTDGGTAMTAGIYDEKEKKGVAHMEISVPEIKGTDYRMIDLGTAPLTSTMYVWFAPPKRPDEVKAVYIDEIVVVREK